MNPFSDKNLWIKIARNSGDTAVFVLEAYKILLSVKYHTADTALKAVKAYNSTSEKLGRFISSKKDGFKALPEPETVKENKIDKEKQTMKKPCIWGIIAFLVAVAAALVAVMMYLKKKEQNLAEYEEMLYSEDYLADYMPKEESECCCDECEEAAEETCTEECCEDDVVKF